ncbi:MAG: aminotransferase class IV [Planctomycetota bacterium]|jgi:branched-subunit amino acid aminotransferase/4-amino-4-deoxychorismate lyase
MTQAILNGHLLDAQDARIPADDRGFLYGESVFTTLRLYGGYPMAIQQHCERLNQTLACPLFTGIAPVSQEQIWRDIQQLKEASGLEDGVLRIRLSSGRGAGIVPPPTHEGTRLVTLSALPDIQHIQQHGMRLRISPIRRCRENPLGRYKLGSYAENVYLKQESQAHGFDDGIFCDEANNLLESSTANLFAVVNGILVTPGLEECILPGITREFILERARAIGVPTLIGPITLDVAQQAEEMFTTNSVLEVVPVSQLGDKTFALVPGPVTLKLAEQYRQLANARKLAEQYTGTTANEQRQSPRHQVIQEVEVINRETNTSLGSLMNLSEEGLLLVGPEVLCAPKDFELRLQLPQAGRAPRIIDIDARCVRTLEVGVDLYGAGFRFVESSPETQTAIQEAIECLCVST